MTSCYFRGDGDSLEVSFDGINFRPVLDWDSIPREEGEKLLLELAKRWPNMGGELLDFSLPKSIVKNSLERNFEEIIFYGGTFNPWHEGHSECLRLIKKENLIVIPDINPWKGKGSSHPWLTYLSIVKRLIDTPFAIYPGFLGNGIVNPTIDWLDRSHIKKISLLIGDDNFLSIEKWKESERLLLRVDHLYVVPRLKKRAELLEHKESLGKKFPKLIIDLLPDHPYANLSSSEIRGK